MEGLGIEIAPLDSDVAKRLGMEGTEGVVITSVRDGSPAAAGRLVARDGDCRSRTSERSTLQFAEFEEAIERIAVTPMTASCCWSEPRRDHASSS